MYHVNRRCHSIDVVVEVQKYSALRPASQSVITFVGAVDKTGYAGGPVIYNEKLLI